MNRLLMLLAAAVISVSALTVVTAQSASAGPKLCKVKVGNSYKYVVCSGTPGGTGEAGDGDGDGGYGPAPACELSETYPTFCKSDGVACRLNDPALADADYTEEAAGAKPGDDYHVAYETCSDGSGRDWFWTTGETLDREDLALMAFGELTFTPFTLTFNPPTRTFVNLDTWWWAEGAGTQTLIGSAAGGIRALAAPDRMEVDPGDGSGVFTCQEFVTVRSDDCSYAYRKASAPGSTYTARMRLIWTVSFEENGTPFEAEGVPTTFLSPWQDVAVPVREVQTLSRPNS